MFVFSRREPRGGREERGETQRRGRCLCLCHLSDRLPCLAPHARAHRRQRQLGGVAAAPCLVPSTAPTPATSDATAPTRDMGRHKESGERSRERGFGPADGRRGRRRHESTARQVTLDDDWQRDVWEAEGARALGCVVVRRPFGSPVDTWHNTRCKQHVANSFLTCLSKVFFTVQRVAKRRRARRCRPPPYSHSAYRNLSIRVVTNVQTYTN
jgi:hypothetical protein